MKRFAALLLALLLIPQAALAALTDGLVSYYKFDESSGNAADSVGSNTLTNTGTTPYEAGKIGNAIHLNGSTQRFSIADASQTGLDITGDNTICYGINFDTYVGSTAYAPVGKINFGSAGNTRAYGSQINITGSNTFDFEQADGTGNVRKGVAWTPSTGTYYYLCNVYTAAAGTVDYYIDAVAQTQQTGFKTSSNNSSDPFFVGAALDGASGFGWVDGYMDELAVWSRALSSAEITQLYNGGAWCQYPFASCAAAAGATPILGLVRSFFIF